MRDVKRARVSVGIDSCGSVLGFRVDVGSFSI